MLILNIENGVFLKKFLLPLLLLPFFLSSQEEELSEPIDIQKISEAFGHHIAKNLVNPELFALDVDSVVKGIKEHADGKTSPLSEEEYGQALASLKEKAYAKLAEKNLADAKEFLDTNSKISGVQKIEDNKLQYRIDQVGSGEVVTKHSTPLIHYTGKYLDGREFGSSYDGEPISLNLDEAIQGFSLGILGMREGEKRILYIHPDLAYGTGGYLAPNALLIFEIEVVKADSPENVDGGVDDLEHQQLTLEDN